MDGLQLSKRISSHHLTGGHDASYRLELLVEEVDIVWGDQDIRFNEVICSIKLLDLLREDSLLVLLHLVIISFKQFCHLSIDLVVFLSKLKIIKVGLVRDLVQESVSHHCHRSTCSHDLRSESVSNLRSSWLAPSSALLLVILFKRRVK